MAFKGVNVCPSPLGQCHSLDSTCILPQLIPGLSQLGANRQPHKKSSQIKTKKKRRGCTHFHIQIILSFFFMPFKGKCHPNWPYCFLFPVFVYCQGFWCDYAPRNSPLRQLSSHLKLVNKRATPTTGHDSSALTATYSSGRTGQKVKQSGLTKSCVLTDILKPIVQEIPIS